MLDFCLKKRQCQENISSGKSSPWGVRGRFRVRLGIGLGLEPGGLFPRGLRRKRHCFNGEQQKVIEMKGIILVKVDEM